MQVSSHPHLQYLHDCRTYPNDNPLLTRLWVVVGKVPFGEADKSSNFPVHVFTETGNQVISTDLPFHPATHHKPTPSFSPQNEKDFSVKLFNGQLLHKTSLCSTLSNVKLDNSKPGSTQQWMTLTYCQDHILTENIWFVWSKTSYSGDKRRCHYAGQTNNNNWR